MRVRTRYTAAAAMIIAALLLTGCFKKVSHDTTFILKPNLQVESGGDMTVAQGVTGYACYIDNVWAIESYDDAVAGLFTDPESGATQSFEPDAVAEPYAEGGIEGLVSISTTAPHVVLVLIYEEGGMYAWRHFDTGENMPQTYLTLQFRTWKSDGYVDSAWNVGMTPRPEPDPEPEPEPDPDDGEDDGSDDGDDAGNGENSGDDDPGSAPDDGEGGPDDNTDTNNSDEQ